MRRCPALLAGLLVVASCHARPTQAPTPSAAPPSLTGHDSEPALWLEAEHFDDEAEPPTPALSGAAIEGFEGPPLALHLDPDGLEWRDYSLGEGPAAGPGSKLRFDYVGTLADGTVFDSTYERAQPFACELGQNRIIPGLERGLDGVRAGMQRKIVIPPALGYGEVERAPIPAHSTLVFYVSVLSVD